MNQNCTDTVRLLLAIAPTVFAFGRFAMKGGTALNLFVQEMPINNQRMPFSFDRARQVEQHLDTAAPRCPLLGRMARTLARQLCFARNKKAPLLRGSIVDFSGGLGPDRTTLRWSQKSFSGQYPQGPFLLDLLRSVGGPKGPPNR